MLYDDRADTKPGEKFVEAELLGCPVRVTWARAPSPTARSRCRCGAGASGATCRWTGAAAAIRALWEACD